MNADATAGQISTGDGVTNAELAEDISMRLAVFQPPE